MVIALAGNNSFALRQRLNELVDEFVAKYGELALERFDGEEAEATTITSAVQALPFLAERKMVVVRSGSANKTFAEQIEQFVSSIPSSTDLIFYEPITDKRTLFYKALKAKTRLEEYVEMDKRELAKWLVGEAKKARGELSLADANYLVERVGTNQSLLYSELQKLIIYSSKVGRENIDLLTEPTPQSKVFDLLDAAFAGRKNQALELYADQRAQQVEPQAILAMIAWQLQLLTLVKVAEGRKSAQIAKDAGVNPYPVNKAAGLVKKISQEKLREIVSEALEIDLKSKTTAIDLDEALKTYITTL